MIPTRTDLEELSDAYVIRGTTIADLQAQVADLQAQLAFRDASSLFGLSLTLAPHETVAQAVTRYVSTFQASVFRVFRSDTLWAPLPDTTVPIVVSFRVPPADILAGTYDSAIAGWFASFPTDRPTFWCYLHEPEGHIDAGEFTAVDYRAAWDHIITIADSVKNPNLHSTVILMAWSVDSRSGRTYTDYVAPRAAILAWDVYCHPSTTGTQCTSSAMMDRSIAASLAVGKRWAIAELGTPRADGDNGTSRAAALIAWAAYARANDAVFVTYFNSTVGSDTPNLSTRPLTDAPSISAWKLVCGAAS